MTTILTSEAGDMKPKLNSCPDSHPVTETPPRTPSAVAVSAHTLTSEIRNIHHTLSTLPDLKPGSEINALLTRLVNLCVVPYNSEFTSYFFGIDGTAKLCEQLRPICAAAEGELERYWAQRITVESVSSEGML
jgi:nicotianamine synthase